MDGKTVELADEDSITPAALMAPRRSTSLRFKLITALPNEACLSFKGLMADNPIAIVSLSTAVRAHFIAPVITMTWVERHRCGCYWPLAAEVCLRRPLSYCWCGETPVGRVRRGLQSQSRPRPTKG